MVNFSRFTVSLTKDLRERMDDVDQVNWSAIARDAFEAKINETKMTRSRAMDKKQVQTKQTLQQQQLELLDRAMQAQAKLTHAQKRAQELLDRAASRLTECAEKMAKYSKVIGNNDLPYTTDSDRMCYAINELENLIRNLNFSDLARSASELSD